MKLLVAFLIVIACGIRGARAVEVESAPTPSPKVVFRKSESHKFSGLMLKGQLKKPDLGYIYKRKGLKAEQIVDIPENFNDEITQGAGQF
jgi:hypothetical protein